MKKILVVFMLLVSFSCQSISNEKIIIENDSINSKTNSNKLDNNIEKKNIPKIEKSILPEPTKTPIEIPKILPSTSVKNEVLEEKYKVSERFSRNYPYVENTKLGILTIIFKDEYKIRYYSSNNEFISKTKESIKILNDFVKNNKLFFFEGYDLSKPKNSDGKEINEEELEKISLDEKIQTGKKTNDGFYEPNKLSVFRLKFRDISSSEIIELLRKEKYILSVNYSESGINEQGKSNPINAACAAIGC
ncbi:MAG: hypothetical protein U0457_15710 [Candidatus Sericytochromatia bacterium]